MLLELRAETADEMRAVGEALSSVLEPGDAIALSGELGAGKTTLVQGAARGLGVDDQVVSPTFTLVREYAGRLRIYHVDVYRLDRVQDAIDLGLEEMVGPGAVLFVEWGDAVEALLPEDRLDIRLTVPDPASEARRVELGAGSASWAARWPDVERALEPFRSAA